MSFWSSFPSQSTMIRSKARADWVTYYTTEAVDDSQSLAM